ncbi:hypothetical protein Tco_1049137 [Tanacetum coccineum]
MLILDRYIQRTHESSSVCFKASTTLISKSSQSDQVLKLKELQERRIIKLSPSRKKLVADKVAEALAADRAARANVNGYGGNASGSGGQARAPPARECSFSGYMKCNPTTFHGNEGAIELCSWFEKTESTFRISGCAEINKVMFDAATLQGRALTWWNSQVATLGIDVANGKPWTEVKKMMTEEF